MYLDGELPAETLKERIESAAALYGAPTVYAYNRDVLQADDMPPLNSEDGQKWLMAEIATVRPEVIIFDNIPCLVAGMLDEEHWKPVQAIVRKLTANRDCANLARPNRLQFRPRLRHQVEGMGDGYGRAAVAAGRSAKTMVPSAWSSPRRGSAFPPPRGCSSRCCYLATRTAGPSSRSSWKAR